MLETLEPRFILTLWSSISILYETLVYMGQVLRFPQALLNAQALLHSLYQVYQFISAFSLALYIYLYTLYCRLWHFPPRPVNLIVIGMAVGQPTPPAGGNKKIASNLAVASEPGYRNELWHVAISSSCRQWSSEKLAVTSPPPPRARNFPG